jgi:integrase
VVRLLQETKREVAHHGRGGKGKGNSRPRLTPLHDLIIFAANTGARLGEIIHLEWSDVRFEQAEIRILEKDNHHLKDRIERIVGANPLVLGMLRRRHEAKQEGESLVFPSATGTVLDRCNVLRELKIVARRVGLGHVTFLLLRHTALTALARTGVPPFVLRQIAGHATLRTTERYYIGDVGGHLCIPPCIGKDLTTSAAVT